MADPRIRRGYATARPACTTVSTVALISTSTTCLTTVPTTTFAPVVARASGTSNAAHASDAAIAASTSDATRADGTATCRVQWFLGARVDWAEPWASVSWEGECLPWTW